jgi:hypothetical protein
MMCVATPHTTTSISLPLRRAPINLFCSTRSLIAAEQKPPEHRCSANTLSPSVPPFRPLLHPCCTLAIMNDEPRAKRRRDLTTVEDFYRLGKEVQNRSGQKLCVDATEERRFREFFGTSVPTAINAWNLLNEHNKLDEGSEVSHMLWSMYFMKCYPRTQEACAAAGQADSGAVDPKTWKKYIWPMIYALADLEAEVVSLFLFICFIYLLTNISFSDQF